MVGSDKKKINDKNIILQYFSFHLCHPPREREFRKKWTFVVFICTWVSEWYYNEKLVRNTLLTSLILPCRLRNHLWCSARASLDFGYTHPMLRTQLKNDVFLAIGTMQMVLLVSVTLSFLLWAGRYPMYTQLPSLSMERGPSRTLDLETCAKWPGGRLWAQFHLDRTILRGSV